MPRPIPDTPATHPTLEQWTKNTQLQVLASSETLDWKHVSLFIEQLEAIPEDIHVPLLKDDVFVLGLEGAPHVYTRIVDGSSFSTHVGAQMLQLVPRHSEFVGHWDSAWTYAGLRLNRSFVGETAAAIQRGDPTRIEFVPSFYFNDPVLYHINIKLTNEMRNASPHGLSVC